MIGSFAIFALVTLTVALVGITGSHWLEKRLLGRAEVEDAGRPPAVGEGAPWR